MKSKISSVMTMISLENLFLKMSRTPRIVLFLLLAMFAGSMTLSARSLIGYKGVSTIGDTDQDYTNGVAVDLDGNIYSTGQYNGTVDFDPTPGTDLHTAVGGIWDFFVTKHNADGSYGWTKTIGGLGGEAGRKIALDHEGNLYIVGEFARPVGQPPIYSLDFDPSPTGVDIHTSYGTALFLTKYNADGSYAWTKTTGDAGIVFSTSMATDSDGNILIAGYFLNSVDFNPNGGDPHSACHISCVWGDAFITKINADGTYAWTRTFGAEDYDQALGIAADAQNNIFVTGYFYGSVAIAGWGVIVSPGGICAFVAKLDQDGNYDWVRSFGSSG